MVSPGETNRSGPWCRISWVPVDWPMKHVKVYTQCQQFVCPRNLWWHGWMGVKSSNFTHSAIQKLYIYIFTFFPVTRVLKVVIPIGCPVGPEVQTLGIFGSNPFYNLIQLIYICITLFPQPFQWGSLDLVSADPSPPPLLILILCPGLPAPNRTCPSNYASGERLNILYIHIYIYMCIFMDWGQCLRLWVCMVHL